MTYKLLPGDCLETMKTIEPYSVGCCVTSPPYYGLRDYGTASWEGGSAECNHEPDKTSLSSTLEGGKTTQGSAKFFRTSCRKCGAIRIDSQIGLEESPEAYVEKLVQVFREVRRVLKDDGTLWLNIGDSYNGSAPNKSGQNGYDDGRTNRDKRFSSGGIQDLKPKDLIGIPWLVAFALRADGWYLRSEIIWHKPNPMPESVTDRPTKSHEQIFLLSKSAQYFYDAEAIRENAAYDGRKDTVKKAAHKYENFGQPIGTKDLNIRDVERWQRGENGEYLRNKRTVWTINSHPYKEAHFATFPPKLIEPCILAGTSEKGECPKCGKAWVRVLEDKTIKAHDGVTKSAYEKGTNANNLALLRQAARERGEEYTSHKETIGWQPQCKCGADPVPQTVLDPFNGSGTTGAVAIKHHRNYIGCELNPDYIELAKRRLSQVQYVLFESNS